MERADIHPSREEWAGFRAKILALEVEVRLSKHLAECKFCLEIMRRLDKYEQIEKEMAGFTPSGRAIEAANELYRKIFRGQSFSLDSQEVLIASEYLLAADSKRSVRPTVENLATVFSSEPEIVLKLMRDNRKNRIYLHLISENSALFSHVLVETLQTNKAYVTDEKGLAEIEDADSFDAASAKWQVKLPEAEFTLEPLKLDPDRTEYQNEFVLESGHGDKVRLIFEGKENGKQIKLEVLSLEGLDSSGPLIAAISMDESTTTHRAVGSQPFFFNVEKLPASIQIRLYR